MLIEMGVLFDQDRSLESERRFLIEDKLGRRFSRQAGKGFEKSLLWSERQRLYAEQHATAADYENGQLRQTIDALRVTAEERERQATLLTIEVERLRIEAADAAQARLALAAHQARPPWLRIARELTPPPLRARAGAALHRARRIARS